MASNAVVGFGPCSHNILEAALEVIASVYCAALLKVGKGALPAQP
jgi:hypothetical protein